MVVLGYLPKLLKGLGLAFAAHFLQDFSIKITDLSDTPSIEKASLSYLFSFPRYQNKMCY